MKLMKEDRHNKIAMRILNGIQNAQKQMTIKWIPAHVRLEGNEKADILTKESTPYNLKMHTEYWRRRSGKNNWNVLKVVEKRKDYFGLR
jgi:ribonuclease HI